MTWLAQAAVLTLVVSVPAFMNLATARIFEEEKALLLRAGALLIVAGAAWPSFRHGHAAGHRVVRLAMVLTLVAVVSTVTALDPRDAFFGAYFRRHGLLTLLALMAVFAGALPFARTAAGRDQLATALVLGSIWPCLYALIQAAGVDPVQWTDQIPGRAASTLGNALLMGGYLVVVIPITAVLARQSRFFVAALVLQLAALAATGSRGPGLALACGALAGAAVAKTGAKWRRALPATLAAITAAALVLILFPATRPDRAQRAFEAASGSARVRVLIWEGVQQHLATGSGWRLAFGYGPESLRHVFPPYYTPEIGRIEQTEAMPDRAHNQSLDTLVASGVAGMICELVFFIAIVGSAVRTEDCRWRAGLVAAAVAHFVEIQLGIATVASRLMFLVAAAIVVGLQLPSRDGVPGTVARTSRRGPMMRALAVAAAVAALTPLISGAPAWLSSSSATGDVNALNDYLARLALAPTLLYASMSITTLLVARAIVTGAARAIPPVRLAAAIAAVAVAVPLCVTVSRADVFAAAAATFERTQLFAEAAVAYEGAVRLAPDEETYLTGLGRTLVQTGRLHEARAAIEEAERRNPHSPYPPRNLASLLRTQARAGEPSARSALLEEADRAYRRAVSRAPRLPALWTEWANVDAERGLLDQSLEKLARAVQLDDTQPDPWVLRGLVHSAQRRPAEALAAFDEALRRRPDDVRALRGRARVLAELSSR